MAELRFVADPALGRLARWLRILGYDTSFGRHLTGRTLLRAARSEGRILLTRDTRLVRTKDLPPYFFVTSDHFRQQLREVVKHFGLTVDRSVFARCVKCNAATVAAAKAQLVAEVPAYVLATQEKFSRCPVCYKVFWKATHYDHVRQELAGLKRG